MRKNIRQFWYVLLAVLVVAVSFYAYRYQAAAPASSPAPGDNAKILIHGLQRRDFSITLADLKKLPTVTVHAESSRSNGQIVSVTATGPLLNTLLKQYGKSQQNFSRVRFSARDKYSIALSADILKSRQVILSYINDGKPLAADIRPVRVVIPGERAMYWVKEVNRIDFETGPDRQPAQKIIFLDTAVRKLPQTDYRYYGETDRAVKISDLISKYGAGTAKNVFIRAGDGLEKNETAADFLIGYLKISGEDAPKFLAPGLPQGMSVREVLFFSYATTAFFDYQEGSKVLPHQRSGRRTGIALSQIVRQTGLAGANYYQLSGADGKYLVLSTSEMGNALIYRNARGTLSYHSSGEHGDRQLDDLLSIESMM